MWVQATDPLGATEVMEYLPSTNAIPATESSIPSTMQNISAMNANLNLYNSFFWDKRAMEEFAAGTTIPTGLDPTKALITHWLFAGGGTTLCGIKASEKPALESRIWYGYEGQVAPFNAAGTWASPYQVGRLVDGDPNQAALGQVSTFNHDPTSGNLISAIDPTGRTTTYTYDPSNLIDLLTVQQGAAAPLDTIAAYSSYLNHLPQHLTDAAGESTQISYNTHGQIVQVTNPRAEVTNMSYNTSGSGFGRLHEITRAYGMSLAAGTLLGYDAYGRVQTVNDEVDNYSVTYGYDATNNQPLQTLDRVASITYPDGSSEEIIYNILDPQYITDRAGRTTQIQEDALRRVLSVTDPAQRETQYAYCPCGALNQITDANGNVTIWSRDLEKRVTGKSINGTNVATYAYQTNTSRLYTLTDPLNQITTYDYFVDDDLKSITYTGALHPTPNVSFTYETVYNRLSTMTDGTGLTQYTYVPTGTDGAGKLLTAACPLANSTITYGYDPLSRRTSRSIGSGTAAPP